MANFKHTLAELQQDLINEINQQKMKSIFHDFFGHHTITFFLGYL